VDGCVRHTQIVTVFLRETVIETVGDAVSCVCVCVCVCVCSG